jgi:FtsH-binding integral membrane protein
MAELDRRYAQETPVGRTEAGVIDQGLRAYMIRVYNYMASGVAITGLVAWLIYSMSVVSGADGTVTGLTPFGNVMYASAFKWVVIFAPLAMVFFLSARIGSMSLSTAQISFWIFAALMGASISSIFLVYAGESIARMFFITAAAFGALSLWGYTTSKDLSGWGSFLFMGLIGIIIAMLVNLFIGSTALQFAVSVIGVLVFAGLTAYDTQQIKEMYYAGDDGTVAGRKAVMGALRLYLDFINLFMMLLSLFGDRR